MKLHLFFVIATVLVSGSQVFAAIACRPGMNNCPSGPSAPGPQLPGGK